MKFKKLFPSIYVVETNTSREAAELMLRFQEHYESPFFKDKVFSLKEYKAWYREENGDGKFTYYSAFTGFNTPDNAFVPFQDGKFKNLTKKEKWLLEQIKDLPKPYCVIAYQKKDVAVKKHEIAHAHFYLDQVYRAAVLDLLENYNLNKIKRMLSKHHYAEKVWLDECHAYILCDKQELIDENLWLPEYEELQIKLKKLFNQSKKRRKLSESK